MKKISYWIRNYFGFSQKEATGFVVLIILILFFLFLPFIYNLTFSSDTNYAADQLRLDSLIAKLKHPLQNDSSTHKQARLNNIILSAFNPNIVGKKEMLSLGFENRIADRIVNFRNKGGTFKIKKDLLKIYNFPDALFLQLQHYILLPDSLGRKNKKDYKDMSVFNINKADTSQLKFLKGIGNILAARIVKYRDKLGGFISKDQFKEVYGLTPSALEELNKYTFITINFTPLKLNLNTADKETLTAHPYLSNKMAINIVNYRNQHGLFNTEENLREIKSLRAEEIDKLLPYINFNTGPPTK